MGSYVDHYYEVDKYPQEGDFTHTKFIKYAAGGCPLNVATVVSAKGIDVKALDMLGKSEDTTSFILEELQKYNVDTSNIQIKENVTNGKVLLFLSNDNRTMFLLDPTRPYYVIDDKLQDLLNNAEYIYSLMHMINRSFENIEPLLEAKRHGSKILLDGSSLYDDPSRLNILYSLCDGLFINETSYKRLKEASKDDPKKLLFDKGGEFIVVTNGSKGSTLYLKDKEIYKPSVSNLEVIDSTGAGDSFAGGFISSLMNGYDYELALSYATVNGAYACTEFSGQSGAVSFDILDKFAKEHNYDLR